MNQTTEQNLVHLRQLLTTHFDDGELRTLCFDLEIDYETLPGSGKADKARELVAYAKRHNIIPGLVAMGQKLRPDIDWDALDNISLFSDGFATSLTKVYRVGGLTLVFVLVGIITMFVGHFYESELSSWIFGVGALETIACLALFLYIQMRGPMRAARLVRENKETIDAVQEIAIELTRVTGMIQSLTFKHIKQVDKILDSTVPLLVMIPAVAKKMDNLGLSDARNVSKIIVDTSTKAETVIHDVEYALVNADTQKLKSYTKDLKMVTLSLRDALAASGPKKR